MECPSCLERYSGRLDHLPKLLPCVHFACSGCLRDAQSCPKCRKGFDGSPDALPTVWDLIGGEQARADAPTGWWCVDCGALASAACQSRHAIIRVQEALRRHAERLAPRLAAAAEGLEAAVQAAAPEPAGAALQLLAGSPPHASCHVTLQRGGVAFEARWTLQGSLQEDGAAGEALEALAHALVCQLALGGLLHEKPQPQQQETQQQMQQMQMHHQMRQQMQTQQLPVLKQIQQPPVLKQIQQPPVLKQTQQPPVLKQTQQLPVLKQIQQPPVLKQTQQLPVLKQIQQPPVLKLKSEPDEEDEESTTDTAESSLPMEVDVDLVGSASPPEFKPTLPSSPPSPDTPQFSPLSPVRKLPRMAPPSPEVLDLSPSPPAEELIKTPKRKRHASTSFSAPWFASGSTSGFTAGSFSGSSSGPTSGLARPSPQRSPRRAQRPRDGGRNRVLEEFFNGILAKRATQQQGSNSDQHQGSDPQQERQGGSTQDSSSSREQRVRSSSVTHVEQQGQYDGDHKVVPVVRIGTRVEATAATVIVTPIPELLLKKGSRQVTAKNQAERERLLQSVQRQGVRRLVDLCCKTDPSWALRMLKAASSSLEALYMMHANEEHLHAAHGAPRLSRLHVLADWARCPNVELPPLDHPSSLKWLKVDFLPQATLLSLLRAHAATLEVVILFVGVPGELEWPRRCNGLDTLLKSCGPMPLLRRLVLRRAGLRCNESLCTSQLVAVGRALPGVKVLCDPCHGAPYKHESESV